MVNAGRVLSKAQILDHVWSYDFDGDANIVESYVSYLRRKLDDDGDAPLIHTVRGHRLRAAAARDGRHAACGAARSAWPAHARCGCGWSPRCWLLAFVGARRVTGVVGAAAAARLPARAGRRPARGRHRQPHRRRRAGGRARVPQKPVLPSEFHVGSSTPTATRRGAAGPAHAQRVAARPARPSTRPRPGGDAASRSRVGVGRRRRPLAGRWSPRWSTGRTAPSSWPPPRRGRRHGRQPPPHRPAGRAGACSRAWRSPAT